jgi:hypothetical protein
MLRTNIELDEKLRRHLDSPESGRDLQGLQEKGKDRKKDLLGIIAEM